MSTALMVVGGILLLVGLVGWFVWKRNTPPLDPPVEPEPDTGSESTPEED